jgi:hypothetical protein
MANRRVSELNELLNTQVAASDLFLITDVSAVESKKIRASELQTYALNGTASYSLRSGTSSYSLFSLSSSYSPATVSASYALSASYADWAKTASYVLSASYALSSSYSSMSFWAITASYALTSSVQLVISSGLADYAYTASYLIYVPGFNNGTSSAAISSSWARMSSTASYLRYSGIPNGTASYALIASQATVATSSLTASYLAYSQSRFNGSASYALTSSNANWATYVRQPMLSGIYAATVTAASESRIGSMSLNRTNGAFSQTVITYTGTVTYNYTGSVSGSLTMAVYNKGTLATSLYDFLPITFSAYGATPISGTVNQAITMQGQNNLQNGDYIVYVTASLPLSLYFDTANGRTMKFRIDSESDRVTIQA